MSKERIATELMGWEEVFIATGDIELEAWWKFNNPMDLSPGALNVFGIRVDDWDPYKNPAHATMVLDKMAIIFPELTLTAIHNPRNRVNPKLYWYCADSNDCDYCGEKRVEIDGTGLTWTQALFNAGMAYLDGIKEE